MTADNGTRVAELLTESVSAELVRFVRALRSAGAEVPANASVSAAKALAEVGMTDRAQTRAALRAAVLTRADDRELFNRLFEQFWNRLLDFMEEDKTVADEDASDDDGFSFATAGETAQEETIEELTDELSMSGERELSFGEATGEPADVYETSQYSPRGASEPITADAIAGTDEIERAVARLTSVLATEESRSSERAPTGPRPDIRRALRGSVSTGGVLTDIPERRRKEENVSGVVFADVSRSMLDVIDREFLVGFLRAIYQSWQTARTFIFDTEVKDISDAVAAETPTETLAALADAETAWGGGTRIGHAIESVRVAEPDVVDRRTIVVIISDGLEMGDHADLVSGMAWLARRSSRILWLNPLSKSPEYEPTAAGMAAALPFIDCLYPFEDVDDVVALARDLELYAPQSVGYQVETLE